MEYPQIYADFVLSCQQDHLEEISEALSLQPTRVQTADQILIEEYKGYHWILSTEKQHSGDTSEQLEEITGQLAGKTKILQELIKKYGLEALLGATVTVEDSCDDVMGLIVSKKVIDFAAAIGAEVNMGVYVDS